MLIRIDNKIKHQARSDFLNPTASPSQEIMDLSILFSTKLKLDLVCDGRQCKYSKCQRNLHHDIA